MELPLLFYQENLVTILNIYVFDLVEGKKSLFRNRIALNLFILLFLCSWLNGYSTAIIFWQYFRPYLAVNPFHPVVFYFSGASNKSKPAWIPDERQIRNSSSLEVIARRWWMFIRNPFPRLATDLNVILLSHQGTESRPWVAKGYSVANEVCTGPPWVMAVTHQSVQTPPGQRYRTAQASVVRWHSADAETMKHIDQKTRVSVGRFDPFHSKWPHFLIRTFCRRQKKSLWERAHCGVSLLIMTAQSASDFLARRRDYSSPP